MKKMTSAQKALRRRLLEIINDNKASHIGSSLSSIDMIEAIYQEKRPNDLFVLSNGHSGYALYTVLEKHGLLAVKKGAKLHVHPEKAFSSAIDVSTGSLGQGLPIAVGLAIGNPDKKIFCSISDGECTEGSIWEAVRLIQDLQLRNIMVLVSANGWGAYSSIDVKALRKRFEGFGFKIKNCNGHSPTKLQIAIKEFINTASPQLLFCSTTVNQFPFLKDQDAHYYVMTPNDYQHAMESLQ